MKFLLLLLSLTLALAAPLRAAESESMADRTLKQLVEQQKDLLAEEAKKSPGFDADNFQTQMQLLCQSYEVLLRENPGYAPGFAAYGYLLGKIGQRKASIAILMRANKLDPDIPLVKNQIGNFLAEEGRPREALPYYLAAIKLEPKEPLYHYQLGTLLYVARDDFIKSGEWTADSLDHATHEAFREAAELAPDRIEFTYRYAESFYDLPNPDWDAALKAWTRLEAKAGSELERQTMRLHEANVLLKAGKPDHARVLLDSVTEPTLAAQKQKLVAQLPAVVEK
jgi:tetratricopeptide (TPR) repeat protein